MSSLGFIERVKLEFFLNVNKLIEFPFELINVEFPQSYKISTCYIERNLVMLFFFLLQYVLSQNCKNKLRQHSSPYSSRIQGQNICCCCLLGMVHSTLIIYCTFHFDYFLILMFSIVFPITEHNQSICLQ